MNKNEVIKKLASLIVDSWDHKLLYNFAIEETEKYLDSLPTKELMAEWKDQTGGEIAIVDKVYLLAQGYSYEQQNLMLIPISEDLVNHIVSASYKIYSNTTIYRTTLFSYHIDVWNVEEDSIDHLFDVSADLPYTKVFTLEEFEKLEFEGELVRTDFCYVDCYDSYCRFRARLKDDMLNVTSFDKYSPEDLVKFLDHV